MTAGGVVLMMLGLVGLTALGMIVFGTRGILRARDAGHPPPVRSIIGVAVGVLSLPALLVVGGVASYLVLGRSAPEQGKPLDVGVRSIGDCPGGGESPCGVTLRAIHALERNDLEAFEATLLPEQRSWVSSLPDVTAAPELQGLLVLRALVEGRSQFALEELRDVRCAAGFHEARTSLDGTSANLVVLGACLATADGDSRGHLEHYTATLHARKVGGRWRLGRGGAPPPR